MSAPLSFTYLADSPERLDKVLLAQCAAWERPPTRSQIKASIERGEVRVNGHVVLKAGTLVNPGAELTVEMPKSEPLDIPVLERTLDILHEDEELIVLDKPAGLSMHPGAGNPDKTLVNALVHHFGDSRPELFRQGARPGIVHRLDKDTTGVVVVAKTQSTLASLAAQFSRRTVSRMYRALVFSTPRARRVVRTQEQGRIETQLARDPRNRKRMAVVEKGGKTAITDWFVNERLHYGCLLDLRLGTGRTHQIRVHMEQIGCPVIGDQLYGDFSGLPKPLRLAADDFGRQALHARSLEFVHPANSKRMCFETDLPADFKELVSKFRMFREEA
ncbi:MAG: RluA family pseudouridine synthase [Oligoflexia bacterium]|nr:RluA family pseudouridine synthase [Oligoflexia bacterium]